MGIANFGMKAGRMFGGAVRSIAGAAFQFGSETVKEAATPSHRSQAVAQLEDAAKAREITAQEFGRPPWYAYAFLAVINFSLVSAIFAYETNNVRATFEALGHSSGIKIFGYATEVVISVILMVIEHYFGFLLLFSGREIGFFMRQGMNILCVSIAVIIISSNFTSLEKRDLMAKKQAENQAKILALAQGSQAVSAKVAAGAEKLAADAGATRTPSLMRAGAKGVADAADAARETALTTREAIKALEKAPPPTNEEVQGPFAKFLSLALAVIVFFGGAICARLCGLSLRRSREEWVVTRDQIKSAANVKTQAVTEAKALPDEIKMPKIKAPDLGIDPAPAAPVVPFAPRNRLPRATERGSVGTPSAPPQPAPAPTTPPKIGSESIPSASIDSDVPGGGDGGESIPRDPEPHSVDSETGRMTRAPRAEIDHASIPLLRALIANGGVESITTKSAAELLRASGSPMSAQKVSAAINNLHAAGFLRRGDGYHGGSVATGLLVEARKNRDSAAILLGDK